MSKKLVKLKDICTFVNGRAYKKTELLSSGKYPVLRVGNFFSKSDWYYSDLELPENKYCDDGDLLFAWSASFGPKIWDGGKVIYHYHIWKILLSDQIHKEYLYYYLANESGRIKSSGHGATMIHVTKGGMEERDFLLPSIQVQKDAAEVISKVEKMINFKKEQLKELDDLIKSRFVEMFGDVRTNDKGWKTNIISDCFDVKGGKRIPKGMGYSDEITKHPYLRATDMKNATILDRDIKYISEEVYEKIKRYTVNAGDIYLTNVGVNLGMAGVIPDKYQGANLTENAVKLKPKQNGLNGMFLSFYLNSPGIQGFINERKMSVGVPKLAIFRIESMPLVIPPIELQNEFLEFCERVDKLKLEVQKSLDETQTLFDSLMQKYFE